MKKVIKTAQDEQLRAQAQAAPSDSRASVSNSADGASSVLNNFRLPKFEMAMFDGDVLKWRGWWDVYQQAIHDNTSLNKVQKFTYLLGFLAGDAKAVAEGYGLCNGLWDNLGVAD